MSSLPRMLLRCCQSVIIALALCLIPDVEAGFAQSARDIASDLETWDVQESILPSEEVLFAEVYLADTPSPEPAQTPEFSDAAPEVNPASLPAAVSIPDFLSQPTIGSQLLLPPGQEAVQLLLAPASESNQRLVPLETQLALPGVPNGERQTSLAPVSSQRFLPAVTQPVGLLPAATEPPAANPLAIAIENGTASTVQLSTIQSQTTAVPSSPQEQVGRTLARTTQANFQSSQASQPPARSVSSLPRSTPALLPASTVPRSPQRSSTQTLALAIEQTTPIESQPVAGPALAKPAQKITSPSAAVPPDKTPKPSSSGVLPPASVVPANAPSPSTAEPTSDPNTVASRELGVTIAPPEDASLWQSWKNQIWIALGALAFVVLALMRWAMSGGQGPLVEETDWDHLPRSKSKTIDKPTPEPAPAKRKRVSEEFLQFLEVGGLAPLRDLPRDVPVLPPKSNETAAKSTRVLASSTLLERKPRQRTVALPWEDQSPGTHSGTKPDFKANANRKDNPQRSLARSSVDLVLWVPIVLISLVGLAAWLIQFYGWGLAPTP